MPESVPLPGFVPIATVTVAVEVVRLPLTSSIRTVTPGVKNVPATVCVGCCENFSAVGVPGVMLNALLVAAVSGELEATSV